MNIYEETSLSYLAKVKEILAPKGSGGKTELLKASYKWTYISCQLSLTKKCIFYHKKDNDGWTSLHNASAQGHLCIVKYLVESASSVDVDVGNT
ncbi:2255_t:CDS:2 [Entrophospora sp. SA101]|nr:2255_t:CDS:2 [Entrophospora sp. SA101]